MKDKNASWLEQTGLIEVHWHGGLSVVEMTAGPIGVALTPICWLELLSLSAVKGGLCGSAIREMAVHMLWEYSETENHAPNMLGRMRILKTIYAHLSLSGMSDRAKCDTLLNDLQRLLEATDCDLRMVTSDHVVLWLYRAV